MPGFTRHSQPYEPLEIDHDKWPVGHYRGRGYDQSHTGPHGAWVGPFFGEGMRPPEQRPPLGPKGYRRTDERLAEEVYDRLASLGQVEDMHSVAFDVKDAVVTLTGFVRSRRAKRLAEDEVAAIWGIEDVVNELRVDPNRVG